MASSDNQGINSPDRKRAAPEMGEDEHNPEEKRLKVNTENLKCSICLSIWHDVVSLTPCQHNFCNACFSQWYKSARNGRDCKCPQCRIEVLYAGRNHAMRSVVEDMIASDPSLKRPVEETEKMDKMALITNFIKLSDIDPRSSYSARRSLSYTSSSSSANYPFMSAIPAPSSDDESDDEDDPVVHGQCLQCTGSSNLYTCPPGAAHLICHACSSRMPERLDIATPQKCELCKHAFCDTYYRSQNLGGCASQGTLQTMSERQLNRIPNSTHKRNFNEQEITRQYVQEHNLTIDGVVKDWMTKVDNAEIALNNMPVSSTSSVCSVCAEKIAAELLDKFRMSIPKTDLPAAAQRPDCWYGHACRTQRKPHHAGNFNHMCEPTSDRVVIAP